MADGREEENREARKIRSDSGSRLARIRGERSRRECSLRRKKLLLSRPIAGSRRFHSSRRDTDFTRRYARSTHVRMYVPLSSETRETFNTIPHGLPRFRFISRALELFYNNQLGLARRDPRKIRGLLCARCTPTIGITSELLRSNAPPCLSYLLSSRRKRPAEETNI